MDGKKSTKDREMSAAEIRFALEETENAFNHLERSQTELKEYLEVEMAEEKIHEKYVEVINKVYPPEVFEVTEWLQQIENNLETHD